MSGHSKWSTIKRQKGAVDVRRGQVFTKLANAITIATREGGGGEVATNFKLRLAVDQARAANMPKENIQRAVERGLGPSASHSTVSSDRTGSGQGQLESIVYEGYGPGKVAVIAEVTTDNRNRTGSEIKGVFERAGGSLATPGAVSWMFTDEGSITVSKEGKTYDEIFEMAADSGAEDVVDTGQYVEVYTKSADLEAVKRRLLDKGLIIHSAELAKKPTSTVSITDSETAKKVLALMEKLEDLDEVRRVSANFDIADEVLKV